jgi:hypothetical protein
MQNIMDEAELDSEQELAEFVGLSKSSVRAYLMLTVAYPNMNPKQQKHLSTITNIKKAHQYLAKIGQRKYAARVEFHSDDTNKVIKDLGDFMLVLIRDLDAALSESCKGDTDMLRKVDQAIGFAKEQRSSLLKETKRLLKQKKEYDL